LWEKEYSDDILIVKAEKEKVTANNYKKMGEKFITHYYERRNFWPDIGLPVD